MHTYASEEATIFHEGIELFNDGEWFEAHEAWEDIWAEAEGDKRRFYQGLIQYAVTIEHIRRGNPRGVRSVYRTAVTKFAGLDGVYMGIDLEQLHAAMKSYVEPVLNMGPAAFDPATGRGQTMPVDLSRAPKIELTCDPFESDRISPRDEACD
jgi:hypothetical protein